MPSIHGRGGIVYLGSAGGAAAKIAEARSWKFEVDHDLDENNRLGDTWRTQLGGFLKFTGSLEANFDNTQAQLFLAATSNLKERFYLYPDGTVTAQYYYGFCWPKMSLDLSLDKVVRGTLSFEGDGQLAVN